MGEVEELIIKQYKDHADAFLSDQEVESALVGRMHAEAQGPYNNYGHRWMEAAFVGRTFVVYRAGRGRREAEELAVFDVKSIGMDAEGLCVEVQNRRTGDMQAIRHVPQRLGRYSVFVQVPPKSILKLEAQRADNARSLTWLMSIGLMLKTRNKPEFHNPGNIYACTLAEYEQKFPSQKQ